MKGTILLVDDEEALRLSLNRFLTEVGYAVTVANDGLDALAQYHVLDQLFDETQFIVLTDNSMPRMKGTQLAEQIGKYEQQKYNKQVTPIILMTGDYGTELHPNIATILTKPLDMKTLENTIDKYVQMARRI